MPLALDLGRIDVEKMQGRMASILFQKATRVVPVAGEVPGKVTSPFQL